MRITEGRIRQIIREETRQVLREGVLSDMQDEELLSAAENPDDPELIGVISSILVDVNDMHHTDADRRAEELFDLFRQNNSYEQELKKRGLGAAGIADVLSYVLESFAYPETSGPLKKIRGNMHRTLGGYILDQLGMSPGDLQRMESDEGYDATHDIMVHQYKQNIATLPKDDPARIRFDGEIAKIKKILGLR